MRERVEKTCLYNKTTDSFYRGAKFWAWTKHPQRAAWIDNEESETFGKKTFSGESFFLSFITEELLEKNPDHELILITASVPKQLSFWERYGITFYTMTTIRETLVKKKQPLPALQYD